MLADKILNFIDGEFVATEKWFDNRTPISNAVIGQVAEAGKAEVDAAVGAARAALKGPWGTMTLARRVELLEALVAEINNRFDEFLEANVPTPASRRVSPRTSTFRAAQQTSRCLPTW